MKKQIKILLLFSVMATCLFGCKEFGLKSFTNNPDRVEPVGDNNDLLDRLYVTIDQNGDTVKVADSGFRKINGVDTKVATGPARIQMHSAPDSSMRIWPDYGTVKGWLTAEDYYDWKLPLGVVFLLCVPLILFVVGKYFEGLKKMAAWAMFAVSLIFFYLGYQFAARQPRVMSEQNSKVLPIEEYRKQKEKDKFVSFWDSLYTNNRIIKK
jgi:hypothetical protein